MHITDTPIPDLKIIEFPVFEDHRGAFIERYNAPRFAEAGLPHDFMQDNWSRSNPGVLRGLHYQADPPMGKLVQCLRGRIWDVAVDIRPDSPTFGQYYGLELSEKDSLAFWMPAGFAHGFCVLGEEPAEILYKVNAPYNPKGEGGIYWADPELAIAWPVKDVKLSDRDNALPSWADTRAGLPR